MAPRERQLPGAWPTEKGRSLWTQRVLAHLTRTVYVDEHLCEEIAELTAISYRTLYSAFVGRQKNLALDVVKSAVVKNPQGTPEDWQRHVLSWARDNGSGQYRPGFWDGHELTYEYNDFLRSIGQL